jgi:tetratricopeptide (TPR) repeat protein
MPTAKQPPAEELDYELELIEAAPRASSGAAAAKRPSGPLGDLASEFEESARASAPAKGAKANGRHATENAELARAANAKQRGASDPGGPLSEIFQEFREQLDELQTDEDPETHYNLGVAYREMGLLEEAISEFQKVAKAHESGKDFRYAMQCCTLLGLAFLEKGQPEIAAFWYERALQTSNLEAESVLALRYDLGVAQQLAGQSDAALKSFQLVYAMNIDYRDVSERITALRKA